MLADDRCYPLSRKPLVIVGGVIANKYRNGGAVWTRLNWVLGFRQLGYDVVFIKQIERNNCLDAQGHATTFELSSNLEYFKKVMQEFDLSESAALVYEDGQECHGMSLREIHDLAKDADLLINITGHLRLPEIMDSSACKVYIDLDPGYTQLWHQAGLLDAHFLAHDKYFTIGEAIGTSECSIPMGDIPWQTTRQPVVLGLWPVSTRGDPERFTTIASWRDDYGLQRRNPFNVPRGNRTSLPVYRMTNGYESVMPRITNIQTFDLVPQLGKSGIQVHVSSDRNRLH